MHVIVHTVSGQNFTSDSSTRDELLEAAGGDETKLTALMDEIYGMSANVKSMDSFSIIIEGVKTYFNPDNIVAIQVFE